MSKWCSFNCSVIFGKWKKLHRVRAGQKDRCKTRIMLSERLHCFHKSFNQPCTILQVVSTKCPLDTLEDFSTPGHWLFSPEGVIHGEPSCECQWKLWVFLVALQTCLTFGSRDANIFHSEDIFGFGKKCNHRLKSHYQWWSFMKVGLSRSYWYNFWETWIQCYFCPQSWRCSI